MVEIKICPVVAGTCIPDTKGIIFKSCVAPGHSQITLAVEIAEVCGVD